MMSIDYSNPFITHYGIKKPLSNHSSTKYAYDLYKHLSSLFLSCLLTFRKLIQIQVFVHHSNDVCCRPGYFPQPQTLHLWGWMSTDDLRIIVHGDLTFKHPKHTAEHSRQCSGYIHQCAAVWWQCVGVLVW